MEHKFLIRASGSVSKTRLVKFIRAHGLSVSDYTVSTSFPCTRKSDTRLVRHMIASGFLTDIDKHEPARKVRGEKTNELTWDTPTARLRARIHNEISTIVVPLVKANYRKSASRWAGGNTSVTIKFGSEPSACGASVRRWSDNGKWSGNDAELEITLDYCWRQRVQAEGLAVAGGMLTTHAVKIAEDCWRASWVEQGRGFDLKEVSGIIVRVGGEFVHGRSELSARKLAARRLAEIEAERLEKANKLQRAHDRIADLLQNGDVIVHFHDSRDSGNCESGTRNWIALNFPNRKIEDGATVRELIEADPENIYVHRACRQAIRASAVVTA